MAVQTRIWVAEKIEHLAAPLIAEHHEELKQAQILWLLTTARPTRKGRPMIQATKKLSPELRFLSSGLDSVDAGYDYIVAFSDSQWRTLNDPQRVAAVDHALCSMLRRERTNKRTGKVTVTWAVRGPDVEEFTEVLERHGLWNKPLERFVKVGGFQLGLPPEAVMNVSLPGPRTTTVDAQGTVITTEVEEPLQTKFVPYEERSSEELANGRPDGDWMPSEEELDARLEKRSLPEYEPNGSVDDLVSQAADEGLDSAHPTPAGVAAQVELERSDEEMAALDATIASDAPPKVPSREQVLANLDARDAALEARATDSWQEKAATWRERVGITQPWRSKE